MCFQQGLLNTLLWLPVGFKTSLQVSDLMTFNPELVLGWVGGIRFRLCWLALNASLSLLLEWKSLPSLIPPLLPLPFSNCYLLFLCCCLALLLTMSVFPEYFPGLFFSGFRFLFDTHATPNRVWGSTLLSCVHSLRHLWYSLTKFLFSPFFCFFLKNEMFKCW